MPSNTPPFKTHYEDELEYLRSLLQLFSRQFPDAASELDLFGHDPATRRLVQGCAFLGAHVREALEARLPALHAPLAMRQWSMLTRPLPASALVALEPEPGLVRQPSIIPAHATVQSRENSCTFRMVRSVTVLPLQLEQVLQESPTPTQTRLTLRFALLPGASLHGLTRLSLLLHPTGPAAVAWPLFALLSRQVKALRLVCRSNLSSASGLVRPLGPERIARLAERLEPFPAPDGPNPWEPLRTLLLNPALTHFVEVKGLEWLLQIPMLTGFDLELDLDHLSDVLPRILPEHLVLHAVPVVNLFPWCPPPLGLNPDRLAQRVCPLPEAPGELFQLTQVRLGQPKRPLTPVMPYFRLQAHEPGLPLYQLQVRPAFTPLTGAGPVRRRGHEVWLSLVNNLGTPLALEGQLQLELLMTNGEAADQLPPDALQVSGPEIPAGIQVRALGRPSPGGPPLYDASSLWRYTLPLRDGVDTCKTRAQLLKLLGAIHPQPGLRLADLVSLERLEQVILDVRTRSEQRMRGVPPMIYAGTVLELELDSGPLPDPAWALDLGDALFACLLARTSGQRCLRLHVHDRTSEQSWTWGPSVGTEGDPR